MKSNRKVVVKKGCHSRGMSGPQGSGISLIRLRKLVETFCLKTILQKGDPRQKPSGMTSLYNGGFTLIELLVVVLIIGILAAVAVPQYQVAVKKSKYITLMHNVKVLANAAEVAYLEYGTYPDNLSNLDISEIQGQGCSVSGNVITCTDMLYLYRGGSNWRKTMQLERIEGYLTKNGEKGLAYLQFLKHSETHPGAMHCSIYFDDTAVATRVCKGFGEQLDEVTWQVN